MKQFSIKLQILLITMIPVFLIDTFLTYVNIKNAMDQAETLLRSNAQIVAEQIANASEFNLLSGNYGYIQALLDQTINNNDILFAAVHNDQNIPVARANHESYTDQSIPQYLFLRQAIYTQTLGSSDIFEPENDDEEALTRNLGWVNLYISRQQLEEKKQQILVNGLILFVSMLVIAMLFAMLVSRRITRPIINLLEHLENIGKGNLGELIEDLEKNEIGEVQKGFNSMSVALLANRMDLNNKIDIATRKLTKVVAELRENNRELAIARDQAQNADRVKSQFLANISHEIRTPINGIKGFVNLLSHSGLKQEQKRYTNIINQSTQDLSNIISEVLDLAKIESGKIELYETEFDIYELVESTRDGLFTVAMEKDIDLYLIIYSDTPRTVIGDPSRLKQVLVNLIGNAIKFTDDGYVAIRIYLEDQQDKLVTIKFDIQDSGIGISVQDQQTLFDAFTQIESDNNRRFSGTGLGLTIAKNLSLIMQGDISIQSELGSGSLFSVVLPFKQVEQESGRDNPFKNQTAMIYSFDPWCQQESQSLFSRIGFDTQTRLIESDTQINDLRAEISSTVSLYHLLIIDLRHGFFDPRAFIDASLRQNSSIKLIHYDQAFIESVLMEDFAFLSVINTSKNLSMILKGNHAYAEDIEAGLVHAPTISTGKVLIVDDNRINLVLAQELVELWGHEAFSAIDANEAMSLFHKQEFDLILLDIQMPKIDGVQLMEIMRRQKPTLKAPIVAITANVMALEEQRLLMAGFDAYIGKPIEEKKLRQLLEGENVKDEKEDIYPLNEAAESLTLDHQLTLKLSAGNEKLANEVYSMLTGELPDYLHSLKIAVSTQKLDELSLIMHKLQGVTCYAGLPRLKGLLRKYAAVKNDNQVAILKIAGSIREELQNIRIELDRILDSRNTA